MKFSGLLKKCSLLAVSLLLVTLPAAAATLKAGEEYTLKSGEQIEENLYVSSGNVTISGDVLGDTTAVGGIIIVNGSTTNDVNAGGGQIDIFGMVGDDVRAIGGQVRIDDRVKGDVVAGGGLIHILDTAQIEHDALIAGGRVIIEGTIIGDLAVYAGDVLINGTVQGDALVFTSGFVEVGPEANIAGDFAYTAPRLATINAEANISGETTYQEARLVTDIQSFFDAIFGAVFITKIFTLLTIALVIALLFQRFTLNLTTESLERMPINALRGILVFFALPVFSLALLLTLLGFMVGVFGLIITILLIFLAKVTGGIIFGGILSKLFLKRIQVNWQWVILGVTILQMVTLIPIIGFIVELALFLVAYGAIVTLAYRAFWVNR